MHCKNPYYLKDYKMRVPCGKCINCRISRQREWATRMVHEAENHPDTVFITLTYTDAHLPEGGELQKRDLQLFFKRLRKSLAPRKIKYFGCGEYGEQTGRCHYHSIIFGIVPCGRCYLCVKELYERHYGDTDRYAPRADCKMVRDAWCVPRSHNTEEIGRVHMGTFTYQSARYTVGYIHQKYTTEPIFKRNPPFQLQSQGIGYNWMETNREQILENGITIQGKPVGLPKYYQKKLEIPPYIKKALADQARERQYEELQKIRLDSEMYPHILKGNYQKSVNAEKKQELFQRRKLDDQEGILPI